MADYTFLLASFLLLYNIYLAGLLILNKLQAADIKVILPPWGVGHVVVRRTCALYGRAAADVCVLACCDCFYKVIYQETFKSGVMTFASY